MLTDSPLTFEGDVMLGILISIFTFILLLICGLMTVIILMQKPSANAGMGAALGGGAAESVFGGETANVLLKYTVRIAVVFFVLSFLLYLVNIYNHRPSLTSGGGLPIDNAPAAAATTAKTTTASTTAIPAASATVKTDAASSATTAATKAPASNAPASPVPAAASAMTPAPKN